VSFRSAWREALRWPGQVNGPAGGDGDSEPRDQPCDGPGSDGGPRLESPAGEGGGALWGVRLRWPGQPDAPAASPGDQQPVTPASDDHTRQRRLRELPWRMPRLRVPRFRVPGVGGIRTLVAAVYGALAEPLVGGGAEARARRAAVVRRTSRMAAAVALAAVLIYAIFPVRTYLDQRAATERRHTQSEVLAEEIERLEELRERLQDDEEVVRIARRDYGLIFPGEDAYGILPAPEDSDEDGDGGADDGTGGTNTGEDTSTTAP
jgi:cell division protein FtsB